MTFIRIAHRFLASQKWVTALLVASFSGSSLLLVAVNQTVESIDRAFSDRVSSTPLIIGRRGSRFDLVLHSIYFRNPASQSIPYGELQIAAAADSGLCVPLLFTHETSIHHSPIIATTDAYFIARKLAVAIGSMPKRLGQCVIGASVSDTSNIQIGDFLQPQPKSAFDVTSPVPIELEVVGILNRTNGPDDMAVITTRDTGWIITGTGHGHISGDDGTRTNNTDGDSHIPETPITRITDENINSFHFHGDEKEYPLSAILIFPKDLQAQTVLEGKYLDDNNPLQAIIPEHVIQEVLESVYRVESILSVVSILSLAFVVLMLVVLTVLSIRLRKQEIETLHMIGCNRSTTIKLVGCETTLILLYSVITMAVGYILLWSSGVLTASYWI